MATIKGDAVTDALAHVFTLCSSLERLSPSQLDVLRIDLQAELSNFGCSGFRRAQLRALLGSKLLKVGR